MPLLLQLLLLLSLLALEACMRYPLLGKSGRRSPSILILYEVYSCVVESFMYSKTKYFLLIESPLNSFSSPERHPTPCGHAIKPRPSHTTTLGSPGERTGAAAELGQGGASIIGALLRDGMFSLRDGRGSYIGW